MRPALVCVFTNIVVPREIEQLEVQISEANASSHRLHRIRILNRRLRSASCEHRLKQELDEAKSKVGSPRSTIYARVVDEEKVAEVVAMMTEKCARAAHSPGRGMRLRGVSPKLKNNIIGQDQAIDKIVEIIQRNRVGLKDPNKPIGNIHVPRSDWCRKDASCEEARRIPV